MKVKTIVYVAALFLAACGGDSDEGGGQNPIGNGGGEADAQAPDAAGDPASCESAHTPCADGESDCWDFSTDESLSFSGFFVQECDEYIPSCPEGQECAFDPDCELEGGPQDFCPGLCVVSACLAE